MVIVGRHHLDRILRRYDGFRSDLRQCLRIQHRLEVDALIPLRDELNAGIRLVEISDGVYKCIHS